MRSIKFAGTYASIYLLYYLFIAEIFTCDRLTLCLFEANSSYDFTLNQIQSSKMFLIGVINSFAIAYIASIVNHLQEMRVYVHIRLKEEHLVRFYLMTIFRVLVVILFPKFILDLIVTGFSDLSLVLGLNASLLITLAMYALVYLILTFVRIQAKIILLVLITINFSALIIYTSIPILGVIIFVPYTLYGSPVPILLWKCLLLLCSLIVLIVIKKLCRNDIL